MQSAQVEIFTLIGEGAALLKALDEDSPEFFGNLDRLREILAMLGAAPAPAPLGPAPLQFSLTDREGSAVALQAYLRNGLAALPEELAGFEAQTVAELAQLIGAGDAMHDARTFGQGKQSEAHQLAVLDYFVSRGIQVDADAATEAAQQAEALLRTQVSDNPEYAAAQVEYKRVSDARRARIHALDDQIAAAHMAGTDYTPLVEERNRVYEEMDTAQTAAWQAVKATHDKFFADRAAKHRELLEQHGQPILDKLLAASPVSQEEADAWAAEQVIDANAKAKLKRLGYAPEQVVRDMAEYYRLSGGKASAIRIGIDGGRRANAVGVTARTDEKVINLGARFNKTVLFHELAHHLENDPIAMGASNGFLKRRRESDTKYTLRSLTGNKGYDTREVAYKDGFIDPYVGKVYPSGITEVFSMGVQYLANPAHTAILAAKDPHMLELITGYLSAPLTPAMHAKLNMHQDVISDMQDKRATEAEQYEKAMALLAGEVSIVKDDWFETLDPNSNLGYKVHDFVLYRVTKRGGDKPVYVGGDGDFRVFSGTFRSKETKRYGKGYLVTLGLEDANLIPDSEVVKTLADAQALIAITKRSGRTLSGAYLSYFSDKWNNDPRRKMIDAVGVENLQ
ncbi:hypothetical protein [Cupriavidus pauculus]|uniref:hypothetical protein n=1 Tax=Cupriavidus pauculus TaxID=82633 RepID=UPI001D0CC379|nr:hypothetical protein [Cupriavidus pauculus]